jgi:threonine dehydrogenase-like Zn-dependent dehydrogenase
MRWWPLTGSGIDNFGVDGSWLEGPEPVLGPGDIRARVEAVTICASDAKMVRLGSDYPLFGHRDLRRDPACLGHELALRVAATGRDVPHDIVPSLRVGVQPDIYKGGRRACIGVNVPGGLADTILLGPDVLDSDSGALVFPVPTNLSRAATALLEPLGCIEGAFRGWGRDAIKTCGRLVVLCAEPGVEWVMDHPIPAARIDLIGLTTAQWETAGGPPHGSPTSPAEALADCSSIDDLLVLGRADRTMVGAFYDRLTSGGTLIWLALGAVEATVPVDLAHFHYGKLTHRGVQSPRLSKAFARPLRYGYKPGGHALVFGASGPMGRVHLMRAIEASDGPKTLVAVARRADKLAGLLSDLAPLTALHDRRLIGLALDEGGNWPRTLSATAPDGFDEVIVVAPGEEPMRMALPFAAPGGLIIGFAGTKTGEIVDLPLGRTVTEGLTITASSGSTVADQQEVIARTLAGQLSPERLIAAVGGFPAARDALAAVLAGRFSGKIMILPGLDWPLMTLPELFDARPDLKPLAGPGLTWSKAIEDAILDG